LADVQEHEQTERNEEYVVYPQHEQRTESELFRHNKRQLVHEMNLPCFKCATKFKPDNPPDSAYEHREVHHWLCEWAAWNAVDPMKVQNLLDSGFFDPYGFSAKMKGQPFDSPDDIRNLIVLCLECHRSSGVGIHHATAPEWLSDMVAKQGTDILLTRDEWLLLADGKAQLNDNGKLVQK